VPATLNDLPLTVKVKPQEGGEVIFSPGADFSDGKVRYIPNDPLSLGLFSSCRAMPWGRSLMYEGATVSDMSDTEDDLDFWGRQLLKKSETNPLRERMQAVISEAEPVDDLRTIRRQTSGGTTLSELVEEGREERV